VIGFCALCRRVLRVHSEFCACEGTVCFVGITGLYVLRGKHCVVELVWK